MNFNFKRRLKYVLLASNILELSTALKDHHNILVLWMRCLICKWNLQQEKRRSVIGPNIWGCHPRSTAVTWHPCGYPKFHPSMWSWSHAHVAWSLAHMVKEDSKILKPKDSASMRDFILGWFISWCTSSTHYYLNGEEFTLYPCCHVAGWAGFWQA